MYISPNSKPWDHVGGGKPTFKRANSSVCILEDNFVSHPITAKTVVIDTLTKDNSILSYYDQTVIKVKQLCQTNRWKIVNYGMTLDGLAVTFGSEAEAAMFRLFWIDHA